MNCGHVCEGNRENTGYGFDINKYDNGCLNVRTLVLNPGMRTSLHWHPHGITTFIVLQGVAAIIEVDTAAGEEDCQHLQKNEFAIIPNNYMHQVVGCDDSQLTIVVEITSGFAPNETWFYKMGDDEDKNDIIREKNEALENE